MCIDLAFLVGMRGRPGALWVPSPAPLPLGRSGGAFAPSSPPQAGYSVPMHGSVTCNRSTRGSYITQALPSAASSQLHADLERPTGVQHAHLDAERGPEHADLQADRQQPALPGLAWP